MPKLLFTPRKPHPKGNQIMKKTAVLLTMVLTTALVLFVAMPNLSWAEDGAAVYKAKCASCHGADAAGKPAAKIPSLTGDEAKKVSDADMAKQITEAGKHPAPIKGLPADDVKAVVTYIRTLQK
jgi:mono/diheme cytochrome c family protein